MPRPTLVLLMTLLLAACGPLAPMPSATPVPTVTPAPATATSAPPTATNTPMPTPSPAPTATRPPTVTPSPSATFTAVPPTNTPTIEPTATLPATATRAPTRPPTNTPAPVAAAPVPACPAWYQAPQPGKALFVIVNAMRPGVQFQNLPGDSPSAQINGASIDAPTRLVVQINPGQYGFSYSSDAGGGNLALSIAAGEMKMLQFYLRPSEAIPARGWWDRPGTAYAIDTYVGRFDIPYGCPGGLPPTPAPPPQCPAWFATPAPDKAVLVVENRSTEPFDVIAPDNGKVIANVPPTAMDGPGRASITLGPGHFELETTTSKRIVVDLVAGTSIVAVHPESRQTPALLPLYGQTPPPACPGYTPPTPPPPPQCPAWFQRPQPGKGVLIIENYNPRVLTVVGVKGVEVEHILQLPRGDQIDRLIMQLNPGHYEFGTLMGGIYADITEGQVYAFAMTNGGWPNHTATVYMPPGCQ